MRVLIGIDGSIASRAAIGWGAARAKRDSGELTLRHVVDDEWGAVGASALTELRANAETMVRAELDFARAHAGAVPVTAEVSVGAPMLTLAAEASGHDLVVVGTHKVGVFHGAALGSRALQLAAMSPVPVAVVPSTSSARRQGVVMGVGGESGEDAVVRAAVDECARSGEPLVLLRSMARSAAAGEQALNRAVRVAMTLGVPAGISEERSSVAPGEALAVRSSRALLTVIGRPTAVGTHGFRVLGRASADLLMNLRGPVLVVPFVHERELAPVMAEGGVGS